MESAAKKRRLTCSELEGILAARDKYLNVAQKLDALYQQASEALTLKESKERTLGAAMCPNIAKMVCLDYERLKVVLSKIAPADTLPSPQDILIGIAQQKITAMLRNLRLDSLAPSLLTLPDALLFDRLGPLVGTESLIGGLSRAHSSFLAPSRHPDMHTIITFLADRAIDTTDEQLEAWVPRLAKTKRAVLGCHMNMGMVRLIESISETLEHLEVDSTSTEMHEIDIPELDRHSGARHGREAGGIPTIEDSSSGRAVGVGLISALLDTRVGAVQIQDSSFQRSLKTLELRKLSREEETLQYNEFLGYDTWYGRDWLANRESVHTLTLSPPFAWDAHLAMELVESTQVKTVRSFTVTADEPDLEAWIDEDNDEPIRSLEAIEGTIKAKRITRSIISSLNKVHKYCVSPGGKEDYSSSSFDFPFTLLWPPTDPYSPIRGIYSDESPTFASSTLTLAASLATSVTFPTSLAQDTIIPAFYSLLPKLVFSSARTLTLQPARDTDNPLPPPLLFNLGRVFPSVRSIDLGRAQQLGEEAVVKTIDDLPSVRVVRFACPPRYVAFVPERPDGFFLPSYLRNCSSEGPLLHIKGAFRSPFGGSEGWSLWDGEEEEGEEEEEEEEEDESSEDGMDSRAEVPVGEADAGGEGADTSLGTAEGRSQEGRSSGGIECRIRRISVFFSAGYEPEPEDPLEEWTDRPPPFTDLFDTCIEAITTLPKLERITLTTNDTFTIDMLDEDSSCGVEERLSPHGFAAVQTGPCSVELYREGLPATAGQRLITDYFSPICVDSDEMRD
ncbi:unnamed protein product [Vitrella brassicaformis CCMP3155]|uniref:Uncharacterized protein n=1 Tax=Vitrella brassicaformis (strain CCMP3155) TaxID=1169540 RepID=A0A0G4GQF1_VITBC|nr:unnamed protein product [Vitrella brassicaformis CCMP3155]|eukprot:CEM32447.1 unnamed protein product [Vitrella brassicaformis CCMP3155]